MKIALQIAGMPNGDATPIDGKYLKSFDFEYCNGLGRGVFTDNPEEAMTFPSQGAAIFYYRTQPKCRPYRDDGMPNRPLTATNVTFLDLVHFGLLEEQDERR